MNLLEIRDLEIKIKQEQGCFKVLDELCIEIPQKTIVGIVGESGCGKTMTALSILKILPRVARFTSGKILYQGEDMLELSTESMRKLRGKEIAMIFQEPFSSLNPVIKIGQQIEDVVLAHEKKNKEATKERISRLLEKVNLNPAERFLDSYPHQLSGGQRQRVMIAMALVLSPKLLIADEPTSALDVTVQEDLLDLLLKLKKEFNLSIIFITHDLRLIEKIADEVYVMYLGKIVESGEKCRLFQNPLHPYTKGLLESMPRFESKGKQLNAIRGLPQDMSNVPTGCAFHPRCTKAEQICSEELQCLTNIELERKVRCWKAV